MATPFPMAAFPMALFNLAALFRLATTTTTQGHSLVFATNQGDAQQSKETSNSEYNDPIHSPFLQVERQFWDQHPTSRRCLHLGRDGFSDLRCLLPIEVETFLVVHFLTGVRLYG